MEIQESADFLGLELVAIAEVAYQDLVVQEYLVFLDSLAIQDLELVDFQDSQEKQFQGFLVIADQEFQVIRDLAINMQQQVQIQILL